MHQYSAIKLLLELFSPDVGPVIGRQRNSKAIVSLNIKKGKKMYSNLTIAYFHLKWEMLEAEVLPIAQ